MDDISPAHERAAPAGPYLVVSSTADGRYAVVFTIGTVARRSVASSLDQVIRQAQHAGGLPIRTDDSELRQRCLELNLPLI